MKHNSADLMQALVAKLYATITGSNPSIKLPRNKFVTWMLPGIPFDQKDLAFCSKGLTGDTAEETLNLYHQAFVISKLCDYVPEIGNQFLDKEMQQSVFTTTQDTISSIYNDILKYSKVVSIEPTEEEKEKIKKYRDLLTVTKEVKDIVTDEMKTVTQPGPLTIAYNQKMNDYIEAADEYMNLLIDSQSAKGSDPEATRRVQAFANKQKFLIKKITAAESAWISEGYKSEYEEINGYIQQVTQRSMVQYKADLLSKLLMASLSSPADGGSTFNYTTILPGNFAESKAWTSFNFYEGDVETHSKKNTSSWGASGGTSIAGFGASTSAKGSKEKVSMDSEWSNFSASFEFTQVQICRPFFEPGFFSMQGWTLDDLWNLNYNNMPVSDGAAVPTGRLIAYPTAALFVRNVYFKFAEAQQHYDKVVETLSGGGSVSYGPFGGGGSYSKSSETVNRTASWEGNGFKIEGMQLIGFINNLIPKSPNLNPAIKPEQLV